MTSVEKAGKQSSVVSLPEGSLLSLEKTQTSDGKDLLVLSDSAETVAIIAKSGFDRFRRLH